jgi:predicted metal-dependent peptidase
MKDLLEAVLSNLKGTAHFSVSDWNTPYIKTIVADLEKAGYSYLEIQSVAAKEMESIERLNTFAPKLAQTMYQNRVESALFNFVWEHTDPTKLRTAIGAPKFSRPTMQRLLAEMAAANNGEFFPLRSVVEKTTLSHPAVEYSEDNPRYKDITTAAATPTGNFIFNEGFMQALINFAFMKGVKPTSRYFKANGGDIPDAYCYAEFVLAHELLHYTHSDFHRQHSIPNPNHKLINYASDMRSNYILVKSGYSQLPLGLYSDEFNFDKYRDFNKLYHDIKAEFDKLPPQDREQAESDMDSQEGDSHEEGQQEGASQKEAGKAKQVSKDKMDEHDKKQDEALEKGKADADDPNKAPQKGDLNAQSNGNPGSGGGIAQQLDLSGEQPNISWKQIIAKFVTSAKPIVSTSWAKVSRRAASTAAAVSRHGAGAIKPGIQKTESDTVNLAIVIDSSGSMGWVAKKVLVEVTNLIKKHFPRSDFFIIIFSNVSQLYRCNLAKNSAIAINDMRDTKGTAAQLSTLLSTYEGGGTVFSTASGTIKDIMQKNYNVLLVTDSDIIGGDNLKGFVDMIMTHRKLLNVILAGPDDYKMVASKLTIKPNNLTYMK